MAAASDRTDPIDPTKPTREIPTMSDARQLLDALLGSLGESSSFAAFGSVAPVLPGLEVKGVGPIGTPIAEADAKRLIAKATQAPYGRGEETIVDTEVRRVWQIEPSQFVLRNAEWNAHLESIVDATKQELGIGEKVNCRSSTSCSFTKRAASSRPTAIPKRQPACSPRWSSACRRVTKGERSSSSTRAERPRSSSAATAPNSRPNTLPSTQTASTRSLPLQPGTGSASFTICAGREKTAAFGATPRSLS